MYCSLDYTIILIIIILLRYLSNKWQTSSILTLLKAMLSSIQLIYVVFISQWYMYIYEGRFLIFFILIRRVSVILFYIYKSKKSVIIVITVLIFVLCIVITPRASPCTKYIILFLIYFIIYILVIKYIK